MLDQQTEPKSEIIAEQLQRILNSKLFAASHRSQDFLRSVVERQPLFSNGCLKRRNLNRSECAA